MYTPKEFTKGLRMTVSTVSQEALPTAVGVTYLSFLASMPPDLVLGSFTGAIIFLLGVSNKSKRMWLLLFSAAFMTGLLGGPTISAIVQGGLNLVNIKAVVPQGMGGMVSAACVVNVISWLRDNPTFFIRKGKGEQA